MPLKGLSEGRLVHYIYSSSDLDKRHQHLVGAHRAALVVNAWPELGRDDGCANLLVFRDGRNDVCDFDYACAAVWVTSRLYSEGKEPGTWHWPERVEC
jgi:hypothetical protein